MIRQILHRLTFSQSSELVRRGTNKVLGDHDLLELPDDLKTEHYPKGFDKLRLDRPLHFFMDCIKAVGTNVRLQTILILATLLVELTMPYAVFNILELIRGSFEGETHLAHGIISVIGLAGLGVLAGVLVQHMIHQALMGIMKTYNGLNTIVFKKSLKVSRDGMKQSSIGDIVNHMGSDSGQVSEGIWCVVELLYAFAAFVGVTVIAYTYLGPAALVGVGTLLLLTPILKRVSTHFIRSEETLMEYRDQRVNLLSQIFSGMRVVKFFVWESKLLQEVIGKRSRELDSQRVLARAISLSNLLCLVAQALTCLASFATFHLLGGELTASIIFASITLFSVLEHPFGRLSDHIAGVSNALVSSERLIKFLKLPESQGTSQAELASVNVGPALQLNKVEARYQDDENLAIKIDSLQVDRGETVAVIGPVGSGKTSLLRTILGEINLEAGDVELDSSIKKVSFVSQESYVLNETLEDNIRFGHDLGDVDRAIQLSALRQDLRFFPAGLKTEIGENGVNLSGGQKQRLSLARAVYSQPDLVLLDDSLSAVDPATEAYLVEQLLLDAWQDTTCVLVTHRLKHLEAFDRIVFMSDGQILDQGSFTDLLERCPEFRDFCQHHDEEEQKAPSHKHDLTPSLDDHSGAFMAHEDREEGAVNPRVYGDYFKAMSGKTPRERRLIGPLLIGTAVLGTVVPLLQGLWLSYWADGKTDAFAPTFANVWGDSWQLVIYGGLSLALVTVAFAQFRLWALRAVRAGEILHEEALQHVIRSPISFFDKNPVGRVLNRFAKDIDAVEKEMPWDVQEMIRTGLQAFMSFVVMVVVVPVTALIMIPTIWVYLKVQNAYRHSARETKRLFSISRSPLFAHFKQTLEGVDTIRAYGQEKLFINGFHKAATRNQKTFWTMILVNRWFSVRMPVMSGVITLAVGIAVVLLAKQGLIAAGLAGLTLLYTRNFASQMSMAVRCFSEVESRLTAVERLKYYGTLAQESSEGCREWHPKSGSIVFENVSLRYDKHLPLVLDGVSFVIPHGQNVGLIGRTGSGKSTLFQSLFRLVEIESGRILIDGADHRDIALDTLRKKIAIIPQDPTLFVGTIRSNLDRFQEFSDAEIWDVLGKVQLHDLVSSFEQGLDAAVAENGSNFSRGQRQLFCFARALLMDTPVICLDEATASVDVITDRVIHTVLHEHCRDKTVLIIAHRLGTVAHCDQVIELRNGKVVDIRRKKAPKEVIEAPARVLGGANAELAIET
ncbi:ABC transporter transmembrane domain-containing protein [Pseudobacteriovorax antillogorgiicola]|uniref:ABC-type multidrug transport system, ATPase and permease component n=1 Tax=Pseudobacteriovorax antillogorgiicola TaxID=1513793 RepID=A0A1Y6BP48_9BACT|nr:ABC transporter transmembrane domain-containing protein [Pseudobacteriovorax antillogorgiicola]TCS54587.1 ABC-type multidrug transport system fused ATPase/permease subunit [Pseudobacteriovorax antillogorgiicola]SMF17806.1 ABC-type multidrug transport system, ATPase and permease component [Pseudobacteriovorax antillogorgiicola]